MANQVQIDMAFLLIGGYAALGRKVTDATRAEVIARDDGKCQQCGKPGTDVDHIDGSSDDTGNLQLLCTDCHRVKTNANMVPAPDEQRALVAAFYLHRIEPDEPRLLADDEQSWDGQWRSLQAARKERFESSLLALGMRFRPRGASKAKLIEQRDEFISWMNAPEISGADGSWPAVLPRVHSPALRVSPQ